MALPRDAEDREAQRAPFRGFGPRRARKRRPFAFRQRSPKGRSDSHVVLQHLKVQYALRA